ncbi:2-phospho-L-lactate guanylyltransferase [Pseudonocardia petroleophila]|uniref:Phosphoenolpyruvate guanylyltransferase n=1 Tax=Pseudonocardia petroleophila TaxID=37331 RepID=A0A7G7MQF2_9PSEU|nr:2-phospho-L-lactate guanylyltransferase [Pseudonocardia petroleophila]QNG55013.1 2-phospho-L-lactate guanylyltransferase [Pseudonocardia petroleophila]
MDLVVPVKRLTEAKTRLRGAAGDDPAAHARLTLALAHDTVAAARDARLVDRLLVVSSDPVVAAALAALGIEVVPDGPVPGLNAAYAHGAALLRARRPDGAVGALQADLPALRPAELDAAITAAAGHARAFCADADGTGTTLLLAAPGTDLDPRFGVGSAAGHALSGAVALDGDWPGLRRDVDTPEDLGAAADVGLGAHTRAVLVPCSPH